MNNIFLMIVHQKSSITGRIGKKLEQRGYYLDVRCPMEGHPLPDSVIDYTGVMSFGGPMSANDDHLGGIRAELDWLPNVLAAEKPFLGVCLGAQILARMLGANVGPHPEGRAEIGYVEIKAAPAGKTLFADSLTVYQWHREGADLPSSADLLATGEHFYNQAFCYGGYAYGIQFHPEVTAMTMERWIKSGHERLKLPGAQQPEQQRLCRPLYDPALESWLDNFLDHMLHNSKSVAVQT